MAWTDPNVIIGVIHHKSLNAVLNTSHNFNYKTVHYYIDFIYALIEIEENINRTDTINSL